MVARRLGLPVLVVVCVLVGVFGFGVSPALAFVTRPYEESFGLDGVAGSKFTEERPGALAIDQATGSIYVGDGYFDQSVSKFNVAHEPEPFSGLAPYIVGGRLTGFGSLRQFAVDSAIHVLYVAGGAPVRAFQPDGEPADFTAGPAAGTNELPGSEVCGVAVDSSGEIYVSEFGGGIHIYASSGESLTSIPVTGVCNLAVDSNGVVYANQYPEPSQGQSGPVEKLVPSAPPPVSSSTTYEPPVMVDENASFTLAVDPTTDHVLVDEGHQIAEYDQAGTRLGTFGSTAPGALPGQGGFGVGLAVNGATGRVYVGQGNFEGQVEVFGPAILVPDVTTGAASEINPKGTVTLNGSVNPDGVEVTECFFEYGTSMAYGQTAGCEQAVGSGTGEVAVSAKLKELEPGMTYHFRLVASNKTALNKNPAHQGSDETFNTSPRPSIDATNIANLTASSVDLRAEVNPGGVLVTDCHFDYGASTEYGHSEPCEQAVGSGTGDVAVSRHIAELHHDITYHWRVVATSAAGMTVGADQTFIYDTSGGVLPDGRAYEMVTPPSKNAALIGLEFSSTTIAEDGSKVIAESDTCFADARSCQTSRGTVGSPFLFSRTSTGWVPTSLGPPANEYAASSWWKSSPEAGTELFSMPTPPGMQDDFYIRDASGLFLRIGPATWPVAGPLQGALPWTVSPVIATRDLTHVAFIEQGGLWPFGVGASETAYQFSKLDSPAPSLVGVSGGPGDTSLISSCNTALGGSENQITPGLMSADGETVYFTSMRPVGQTCPGGTGINSGIPVPVNELYVRSEDSHTTAISEPAASILYPTIAAHPAPYRGCVEPTCVENVNVPANWRDAEFVGASADGAKAFFTSSQQLTDRATEGSMNLYEYDFSQPLGENLRDCSAGDTSGHGPRVLGVAAVSADGSHVYFVAQGALTSAPNQRGESARDGANNLYACSQDVGEPIAFVAQLPSADGRQWESNNWVGLANVTPDGRFLVFESHGRLTQDTTRTDGAAEIFRYDAQTRELVRISTGERGFNNNGNAGFGDAHIVAAESGSLQAGPERSDPSMSHDGSYVFFESPIGLVPHALNDVPVGEHSGQPTYAENIYEWHEGQVHLISDGRDTAALGNGDTSAVQLIGSDATGTDVFFKTADALLPGDTDTQVDFYDARICTNADPCVSQPPATAAPCLGEACHGIPATQFGSSSAGTVTFNGQGNVSERVSKTVKAHAGKHKRAVRCPKGKRRIRGKCIKTKAKHARKSKAKTNRGGK